MGPHGIDNMNIKGRELLYLYKTNNLKNLFSYFKQNNYITYRLFNDKKLAHMLDNFAWCNQLFKRISDCKVTKLGLGSDHTAIVTTFRLTYIKFKNGKQESTVIDWGDIRTDEETKYFFIRKLYELIKNNKSLSNDYTTFKLAILLAAQDTATKERTNNQGWFHHSELIVLPAIQHQ